MIFLVALILFSSLSYVMAKRRAVAIASGANVRLLSRASFHGLMAGFVTLLAGLIAYFGSMLLLPHVTIYVGAGVAIVAAALCFLAVSQKLPARQISEGIVLALLILASAIAIFTTVGIVASVLAESFRFFSQVSIWSFLFGTEWAPTAPVPSFGFIPLLVGTLLITLIAIIVAAPIGLLSAIYMAEYSNARTRQIAKPLLELLAGVPTVVLGFFAALTVAPYVKGLGESLGLSVSSESALAAGLVMGMMIVPLISSLSDDVINAVPQAMRDGSYAMGATKSETIRKVVLPAALPGIVSAFILAISRAIGETMIVVMAAGLAPNLTFNPFAAVTTVTVQISAMLVGDQEFDSAKTLSAFALGLTLFVITLALNIIALRVVRKYKEQYA
ncbi:phosphate ABC transporter permease subunit PstC [Aestuariivirga litoralis]|uniref:phosphate ABC transporter permease subunit PstC n=1 Tax=Aestuariivirga litoralis TaxID=2650924 RepID=UPI0018C59980|nr:phosphate ABC transporter permease subunit PstC [Aestuariivirga litoralis]MBG1233745.1 phosphate ABC transporter permease subunit PstC [Aestuariivirga litoralis]